MKKKYLSLALSLVFCLTVASPLPFAAAESAQLGTYTTISAGWNHTAAIDQNGALWMWGDNSRGQLGNGGKGNVSLDDTNDVYQNIPMKLMDNVASVVCGDYVTAAIKTDGSLWMWGDNLSGELDNGGNGNAKDSSGNIYQTTPVKIMDDVAAVSFGENCTAAIKTDGSLWTWESNSSGQLGNGGDEKDERTTPVKIMDNVTAVSYGRYYAAAVKTDGSLWTWGLNTHGELGNGGDGNAQTEYGLKYQTIPVKIMDNVAAVNCEGTYYAAAIKKDGSLWTWGSNSSGQLGNGGNDTQKTPVKIMNDVVSVSCGSATAAIKTDGSLWMWGNNSYGELGNGGKGNAKDKNENKYQTIPIKIMDNVVSVNCGRSIAAIKADGSLWTWGAGDSGTLGSGGSGNTKNSYDQYCQTTPVKVMDNATAVSFGWTHVVAVQKDGALWACGNNMRGQLGNGGEGNFYIRYQRYDDGPSLSQNFFGKVLDNVKLPGSGAAPASSPSALTAQPTNDNLAVDGISQIPTAYKINGANYFKLRDVAILLNDTAKQFAVDYDGSVILTTDQPYQSVGGELAGAASGAQSASVSNDVVYIDGEQKKFTIYKINGANYFKLRDVGETLNFYVGWSKERGVYIETDKLYQE